MTSFSRRLPGKVWSPRFETQVLPKPSVNERSPAFLKSRAFCLESNAGGGSTKSLLHAGDCCPRRQQCACRQRATHGAFASSLRRTDAFQSLLSKCRSSKAPRVDRTHVGDVSMTDVLHSHNPPRLGRLNHILSSIFSAASFRHAEAKNNLIFEGSNCRQIAPSI